MQRHPISAQYLKTSLNLAKIEQKNTDLPLFNLVRKERNLLLYKLGETQYLCIFSFGVVVTFGFEDKKEIAKLLRRCTVGEEEVPVKDVKAVSEDYAVIIDPEQPENVDYDFARFKQLSLEKLLLVFHVIAQSVAIDFLENQIGETLQDVEIIHSNLAAKGSLAVKSSEALKMVGKSGNMVHFIINRLSLLDKPDTAWEDKDAESLFTSLRKMFELDDRFSALQFKIEFVQDSSQNILNTLAAKRSEYLEIIIIVLIAVEIIMAMVGLM
jgi:required for meiotic nuclear division protein 1